MERAAAISFLQDTVDTLAALNIELATRVADSPEQRRRMQAELQEAIANIRTALTSLEENLMRMVPSGNPSRLDATRAPDA